MTNTSTFSVENQTTQGFKNLDRDMIQKILATVAHDKAFFFYEGIGKPTGDYAISLSDFCNKINSVGTSSLVFHLKRGDFENWILETIGDNELSKRMEKLRKSKTTWKKQETLRKKLYATVKNRVTELQDFWHYSLKTPTSVDS